ncbi:MAG: histidine kinase dimerization/phospho-acceptor domain-containing protein [Gemmataceae bacterium]
MRSLRFELQVWHSLILAAVLAGFGIILYVQFYRARLDEIDADLLATGRLLEGSLRSAFAPPPMKHDHEFEKFFDEFDPPFDDGKPKKKWKPKREFDEFGPGKKPPLLKRDWEKAIEMPPKLMDRYPKGEAPYYAIWLKEGELLKSTAPSDRTVEIGEETEGSDPSFRTENRVRELRLKGHRGTTILVARPIEKQLSDLRGVAIRFALTGIFIWIVAFAGGWFLSRRVLSPLEAMNRTAQEISAKNLSRRIEVPATKNELSQLAEVLNEAFDRLEQAFDQQVRFIGDASHELRTPVAVLISHIDLALSRERTPKEYQTTLKACRRATDRMRNLIESLLTLARIDSGEIKLDRRKMDLSEVVSEVAEMIQPLADARSITLETRLPSVPMEGDAERLSQVAANLLTNAILYNREGGGSRRASRSKETTSSSASSIPASAFRKTNCPPLRPLPRGDPSRAANRLDMAWGLRSSAASSRRIAARSASPAR